MAIEFLASSRSALKFFGALASCDAAGNPILTRLGSLQTVYADMLGNVVRLELAVKNLASGKTEAGGGGDLREKSLKISLDDIITAEQNSNQCRAPDSASRALLWLARTLNFGTEFFDLLYKNGVSPSPSSTNEYVQEVATKAYTKTLREFHDWSERGTATVSVLIDLNKNDLETPNSCFLPPGYYQGSPDL